MNEILKAVLGTIFWLILLPYIVDLFSKKSINSEQDNTWSDSGYSDSGDMSSVEFLSVK